MDAFIFSIALFAMLLLVGAALQLTCVPDANPVKLALTSPGVGLAALVLPVFLLNRAGYPVKTFGLAYAAILIAASAASLIPPSRRCRIRFDWAIMALIVAGLLFSARPMFDFGFDWIGFANDDMANYCLAAQRYYEHGYFAPPDITGFLQGRSFDTPYWFLYVYSHSRSGSELLLAEIWAASGINPQLAFMPTIYALFAALLCATASLVWDPARPGIARVTTALLALSPMTNLGAYYQLIAQFAGLTLLVLTLDQLCIVLTNHRAVGRSIVAGTTIAGLGITYPEVTPFLIAGSLVWLFAQWHRDRESPLLRATVTFWGQSALVATALLNVAAVEMFSFLLKQVMSGTHAADPTQYVFPYFLLPSGLPAVWGLIPIAARVPEPWLSAAIATGVFALLLLMLVITARCIQKRPPDPWICMCAVMLTIAFLLFYRNNDFGLFKLVMFAQPFLFATMGASVTLPSSFSRIATPLRWTLGTALIISMMLTDEYYTNRSACETMGSFCQLPGASRSHVLSRLRNDFPSLPPEPVALHTNNRGFAKLEQLHAPGKTVLFPANQFGRQLIDNAVLESRHSPDGLPEDPTLRIYAQEQRRHIIPRFIDTADGPNQFFVPKDYEPDMRHAEPVSSADLAPFNHFLPTNEQSYGLYGVKADTSKLLFIASALGHHYYDFENPRTVSFYGFEPDPMFPQRKMAALGRHLLFEVSGSEAHPRCVLEITATLAKQFSSALPDAKANGLPFGAVGRGSARLISPPLNLESLGHFQYLSLDLGRPGQGMQQQRTGLMALYGDAVRSDRRQLTVFGRDISLLSEEAYQKLRPPAKISRFPSDLADPNLEYSGIYEDGWISESVFVRLQGGESAHFIRLTGMLPAINDASFSTTATVSLNGRPTGTQLLHPGAFDIKFPVSGVSDHVRVDIHFSRSQTLPYPDGRPTAAHLSMIGFSSI